MLSEEKSKKIIEILLPIFILLLSSFVISKQFPKNNIVTATNERLEEIEKTVEKITIVSISTSVAITFLPDDIGSSIANSLAELNKYFVAILAAINIEKIILNYGTVAAFRFIIPIACILYVVGIIVKKRLFIDYAIKIVLLAFAVIAVVPCGTKISSIVCNNSMNYVNDIIVEAEDKSDTITDIITSEDEEQSILERISNAFKTAISDITDMISYFNGVIKKFITAISILIVATCIIPLVTFFIFVWIIKQLFNISWNPAPIVKTYIDGKDARK